MLALPAALADNHELIILLQVGFVFFTFLLVLFVFKFLLHLLELAKLLADVLRERKSLRTSRLRVAHTRLLQGQLFVAFGKRMGPRLEYWNALTSLGISAFFALKSFLVCEAVVFDLLVAEAGAIL